jgi:hypothetical protein
MDEQASRFNERQSRAFEQFIRFNRVEVMNNVLFRSSGLVVISDVLTPFDKKIFNSSAPMTLASTVTSTVDWEVESSWSKTITAQARVEFDKIPVLFEDSKPAGSNVEVCGNSIFDLNTAMSPMRTGRYPNWKDNGRSSSTQWRAKNEKRVSNMSPATGRTSNIPPNGGELVVIVTLVEEDSPLLREQLRVKRNDDCLGRLSPATMRLTIFGVASVEGRRESEIGDEDRVERSRVTSSTVQEIIPPNRISTLPRIFNFDDGFILDPDNTSKVTTGDRESRMESVTTFSHLRPSSMPIALPLITILNTFLVVSADKEEELKVTFTREKDELSGEKMSEEQSLL